MQYNLKRTILYKCPVCGEYEEFDITIFDFSAGRSVRLECTCCGANTVEVKRHRDRAYVLVIPCIACSDVHTFEIEQKNFWNVNLLAFGCPDAGVPLCIIGTEADVHGAVSLYDDDMEDYISEFGECFCENEILEKILDKLHGLDREGNISCACGGYVRMQAFCDRVFLICEECSAIKMLPASTPEDFKAVDRQNNITVK